MMNCHIEIMDQEKWMKELMEYAMSICGADIVDWYDFDFENYADSYDYGYTPAQAWQDEVSYWDGD